MEKGTEMTYVGLDMRVATHFIRPRRGRLYWDADGRHLA
jgi:hypothetical protein